MRIKQPKLPKRKRIIAAKNQCIFVFRVYIRGIKSDEFIY